MSTTRKVIFSEADFANQVCQLNCEKVRVCRIVQTMRENPIMGKLKISDCSEFVQVV